MKGQDQVARRPESDHVHPIQEDADTKMAGETEVKGASDGSIDTVPKKRSLENQPSSLTTLADQSSQQWSDTATQRSPPSTQPAPLSTTPDSLIPSASAPRLGALHKRRASTSPEKFNTGKFEPLPLQTGINPYKRARLENKLEIKYDETGTPRIASATPSYALPSGRTITGSTLLNPKYRQIPPPTVRRPFSVLNAILRNGDLIKHLVSCVPIPALITLYAISKPFHYLFNGAYTAYILENMRTWAPGADKIYPWRCYAELCIKDPRLRQKSLWKGQDVSKKYEDLRDLPSIRWLQMVAWRYAICKDMLIQLATKGLRCPAGSLDAVRRVWFIMDLPLNAHRIALMRSESYITNKTLFRATTFFLKVDMFFTDPDGPVIPHNTGTMNPAMHPPQWQASSFTGVPFRKLLTAERHLTSLWRVLRGWGPDSATGMMTMTRLDLLKLWVRHKYHLPVDVPDHIKRQSIMGVPWHQVGTANLERTSVAIVKLSSGGTTAILHPAIFSKATNNTHQEQQLLYPHAKRLLLPTTKPREELLRPDELVMKEGVRRKGQLHRGWARAMLWGFCDDFGRNLPLRTEKELLEWSQGKGPKSYFIRDEDIEKAREEMMKRMRRDEEDAAKAKGEAKGTVAAETEDQGEGTADCETWELVELPDATDTINGSSSNAYINFQLNSRFGSLSLQVRPSIKTESNTATPHKASEYQQEHSLLFQLPAELRLCIYEMILHVPTTAHGLQLVRSPAHSDKHTVLALILTCGRVLAEAVGIFYSINRLFNISPLFWQTIGQRRKDAITMLSLSVSSAAATLIELRHLHNAANVRSIQIIRQSSIRFIDPSSWRLMAPQLISELEGSKQLDDIQFFTPDARDMTSEELCRKAKLDEVDCRLIDAAPASNRGLIPNEGVAKV
ncbi:hypothetical protein LTR86_003528 [Recurvomyces mirabilis]|nr:hypothetical protein LTR86_003528 [Recurvomyces mirabilis]